jgi:hypothetical protein
MQLGPAGDRVRMEGGVVVGASTYYATSAAEPLARAQQVLDRHVTSSATGRCLECESLGPCGRREGAVAIFARSLRLPVRQPGASRPELVGAVRVGAPLLPLVGSDERR